MKKLKFSSKLEEDILKELREYSRANKLQLCDVLSDAVREYLQTKRVRPLFKSSAEKVIAENRELFEKLAR